MPDIATIKESPQAGTPIVVFDLTFPDGTLKYFATHAVTFNSHAYEARVLTHNISGVQSMNETGLDLPPTAQFELADADTDMTQLQNISGFKGATVIATFLIMNAATQLPASSDSIIRFVGICNNPQDMSESGSRGPSVTITAQNQFSAQRQQIPPVVLGRDCWHDFPTTAAQRLDGAINRNSRFYGCGYSQDVTPLSSQPVGSLVGGVPATSCTHSRTDCVARGMFYCDTATTLAAGASGGASSVSLTADIAPVGTDIVIGGNPDPQLGRGELVAITGKSGSGPFTYNISPVLKSSHSSGANVGRYTARFSGNELVPITYNVRGYGGATEPAPVAGAQYGEAIPMPYGHVWVNAKITALRGDGNNQRIECVVAYGEIDSIVRVVVNGYELPLSKGQGGGGNTTSGWYSILTKGSRTGGFNLESFTTSSGDPIGDPYGSMGALSIVVPKAIASGNSYPQIRVELTGRLIEGFDGSGASIGWAYRTDPCLVLIDALKICQFPLARIDTAYVVNTSAPVCDATINTLDDYGNTVSDQRFHFAHVFDQQIPGSQVVQGIRNNARIYVNWVAGKLRINVENTIAIEQPSKPLGSNATGTIAGGWPAYVFDESNIIRANKASTFKRYFKAIPQTQNQIQFSFFDQWNGYVQDTYTLNDLDEQALAGFNVPASSLVFGSPAWDQSTRIGAFMLAKSVAGNDFIELISSVKAVELQLGQICAVTYVKEGITNFLYRIIKLEPTQNFRQTKVTLQFHDDDWYADTYGGTVRAPIGKPWFDRGARAPWPVRGNTGPPVSGNVLDKAVYDSREVEPHVSSEDTITNSDGSVTIQLTITASGPPVNCSPTVQPPIIDPQCTILASGGALPTGAEYYAVAAVDADGYRSHRSTTASAIIPSGSVNRAQVTGIKLPSNAVSMVVYRGRTPQTLVGTAVASATSFTDDGSALGWAESPYDPFYDHVNWYWRNVDSPSLRLAPTLTNLSSSTTIGNAALTWTLNQFAGSVVEIVRGTGVGQRRYVTSNTTGGELTVPAWQVAPGITSVFVIYSMATSATATTVTDSTAAWGTLDRKNIKVIDGTGRYQERRVLSNTGTQITVDAPWDTIPDSTSAFEIADSSWSPGTIGTSVYGGSPLASNVQGLLDVPNVTNTLIEYACVGADAQQMESMLSLGCFARYAVAGHGGSLLPAADVVTGFSVSETGIIGTDGTLSAQLTATFTPPSPLGSWAGIELYIQGDGASGHYGVTYSFIAAGLTSPITVTLPPSGETATITAFSFNTEGALNTSAGPTASVVLNGQTGAPNAPTTLTVSTGLLTGGQVLLAWDANSTNKDLAFFDVARRYDATTPTATDIIFTGQAAYQNPATRKQTYIDTPGPNAAQARYYVRWGNSTQLVSAFTGPATATALAPDGSTDTGIPVDGDFMTSGGSAQFLGGLVVSGLKQAGALVINYVAGSARAASDNMKGVYIKRFVLKTWADTAGTTDVQTKTIDVPVTELGSYRFVLDWENRYLESVDSYNVNYFGVNTTATNMVSFTAPALLPLGSQSQDNAVSGLAYSPTTQAYGASKITGHAGTNVRDGGSLWQEKTPISLSRADGCVIEVDAVTANGDLFTTDSGKAYRIPIGTDTYVLTADSTQPGKMKWAAGGSGPSLPLSKANGGTGQDNTSGVTSHLVWAGNHGGSGAAEYRALQADDIPAIDAATQLSGVVAKANGGTGSSGITGLFDSLPGDRKAYWAGGNLDGASPSKRSCTATGLSSIDFVIPFVDGSGSGANTVSLDIRNISGNTFDIYSNVNGDTTFVGFLAVGT